MDWETLMRVAEFVDKMSATGLALILGAVLAWQRLRRPKPAPTPTDPVLLDALRRIEQEQGVIATSVAVIRARQGGS